MTVTAIKMNKAVLRGVSGALSPGFVLSKMIPLMFKINECAQFARVKQSARECQPRPFRAEQVYAARIFSFRRGNSR